MTDWYYSDSDRNRHGPVKAEDLAALHSHGQLAPETLVWREGMANWRPWREMVGEVVPGAGRPAVAAATFATAPADAAPEASANPYAVAEPVSPYAPPRASVEETHEVVLGHEIVYAGFWKRVAASIIDSIVAGIAGAIVQMVLMMVFFGIGIGLTGSPEDMFSSGGAIALLVLVYLIPLGLQALYFAMFHASSKQATLGKMAVGIKVTDDDGGRISLARGIGRYFAYIVSSLILCIGLIMAAFTDRKRALHDMMAGTLVVDQWAFTAYPERQRRELGTVATVLLVIGGVLVALYLVMILFMVAVGAFASSAS